MFQGAQTGSYRHFNLIFQATLRFEIALDSEEVHSILTLLQAHRPGVRCSAQPTQLRD